MRNPDKSFEEVLADIPENGTTIINPNKVDFNFVHGLLAKAFTETDQAKKTRMLSTIKEALLIYKQRMASNQE